MNINKLSDQSNKIVTDIEKVIELEASVVKLTSILESSRDVLYTINYELLTFDFLSHSVIDMTGYSREEIIAMRWDEYLKIVHPDDRVRYKKYWESIKERNIRHNQIFEYRIKPKRGITKWLSDKHLLIFNENDQLVKLIGNIRDITDIKLVEDALQRSRDRLSMAMEATNDGMWDWKLNTNDVYFDVRFYTMLGYEPYEFPGAFSEWMKRIHPDDIGHVQNLLNKHLEGKLVQWLIEYRFLSKDGTWIWILNRGKVFQRDYDGKAMRMVGTHSDLTFRKKAELKLKQKNEDLLIVESKLKAVNYKLTSLNDELQLRNNELQTIYDQLQISEEKFRQLAENTLDVFWLCDQEILLYINPLFEKVWGRSREEVYQNPSILNDWVHPDDKHLFNNWISFDFFLKGKPHIEKYRIIHSNGEIRWIWFRIIPVYEGNKIYRLVGIATDITEQQKTEDALIASRENALESDRLKSAFLANISHEIRTPMNGIIGFSELLKAKKLSNESRSQYINIISKSSEQLLHIINDIVDISKIESNQIQIKPTDLSIKLLFSELELFYQKEKINIGKGNIQIYSEIDNENPEIMIHTDESRLRQILMNLISNAFKFIDKGKINFGYKIVNNNTIEFFVKDTGIGIPVEMQTVIFKRFYQVNNDLTRNFGGTGLGLSICEGLVKMLGGKIWLKSEKQKGSVFYFTLPLKLANDEPKKIENTKYNDNFNWAGYTILIVEDDDINQEFLSAVFIPTKAKILSASSGEEAVSICALNSDVNIVLMDIRLPQMSGYEAFKKIRKLNPKLPVIAQTAFALTEDSAYCLELGFIDFVPKPINRKHLLSVINKHLLNIKT